MNNGSINRKELFETIGAVSFMLDDLRLYLDTHPDDDEALKLFNEYQNKRHTLIADYTAKFGPINAYYPGTEDGWTWINEPMPWRTEAN